MDGLHNTGDLSSPLKEKLFLDIDRNNSYESVNLFKATVQLLCPSGPWELWATNESIQTMQCLYLDTLSEDSGRRKIRKKKQKMKLHLLIYQVTLCFLTALLASLHQLPPQPWYTDIIFLLPGGTHPLMKYTCAEEEGNSGSVKYQSKCQHTIAGWCSHPWLCFRSVLGMSVLFLFYFCSKYL